MGKKWSDRGQRVRQMRMSLGLNQTSFGKLFDVHYSTIGSYETTGKFNFSDTQIQTMVENNLNPLFFFGHGDFTLQPEPWSDVQRRVSKLARLS